MNVLFFVVKIKNFDASNFDYTQIKRTFTSGISR